MLAPELQVEGKAGKQKLPQRLQVEGMPARRARPQGGVLFGISLVDNGRNNFLNSSGMRADYLPYAHLLCSLGCCRDRDSARARPRRCENLPRHRMHSLLFFPTHSPAVLHHVRLGENQIRESIGGREGQGERNKKD